MIYEHYLLQPKQKIEWMVFQQKIYKNSELIKTLRNISHPLTGKHDHIIHSEDEDDI